MNEESNHVHNFIKSEVPSTCKERGYTLYRCQCGAEHKEDFKPLAPHNFLQTEGTAATCTEAGERIFVCSVCGERKTEAIPSLGHSFGEWQTQSFATCTEDGLEVRFCTRCGLKEERVVKAKGHKLTNPKKSETEKGMIEYFCPNCGETVVMPETSKKAKRIAVLTALLLLLTCVVSVYFVFLQKPFHYHMATQSLKKGDYESAYYQLNDCKNYKNSNSLRNLITVVYSEEETVSYDENGNIESTTVTKRDEYGNITSHTSYDGDGTVHLKHGVTYEYDFDSKGNIISVTAYDKDGEISYTAEYEYDKDNHLIEKHIIDDSKVEYEYDNDGNLILVNNGFYKEEHEYDKDGKLLSTSLYYNNEILSKDEYDSYENTIRSYSYSDNGEYSITSENKPEYDDRGNIISAELYDDGILENKCKCKYDSKDNLIRMTCYDASGNMTEKIEYEYDKKGNLIHSATYDEKDNLVKEYKCSKPIFILKHLDPNTSLDSFAFYSF